MPRNELGQEIGEALPGWKPRAAPPGEGVMNGGFCKLERLSAGRHAAGLYDAFCDDKENRIWTYLPYGPFADLSEFHAWIESDASGEDPLFHTIIDAADGNPIGVASYLRITPAVGVIEVGHINFSPRLQRRAAATEAMYLMMARVFDELGYRRYEWKCDSLNKGSRRAAERLGFRFEGIFRQATIYKQRNRDTAWYAILDSEWPRLKRGFEIWLSPENFDADGQQRRSLSDCFPAEA